MKSFNDTANRTWQLSINIATVKRVKEVLEVDLLDFPAVFDTLAADMILLCNVLYILVEDQCEKANVSDEDFGRSMAGDCFEAASDALLDELINFFPQRRRDVLRQLKTKTEAYQTKLLELAEERIQNMEVGELLQMNTPTVSGN